MKKTLVILTAVIVCFAMLFTACKKAENAQSDYSFPQNAGYQKEGLSYSGREGAPAEANPQDPSASQPELTDVFIGRKVIKNASLVIETLEFDNIIRSISEKVLAFGGYIQSNNTDSRGWKYGNMRYADMTVRIPSDKLDQFLLEVDGIGNVIERHENVDDVTEQYVDIEARLASVRTEYDTLLKLLADAEDLDTIILLQNRLSDVRYEIESYEARLRSYDSLVQFSTVKMTISEVERESPVEKESFGKEVSRRFGESLEAVGDGFRAFALWFIGDLPIIIIWVVIIAVIAIVIIALTRKSSRRKKEKKAEKAAEAEVKE